MSCRIPSPVLDYGKDPTAVVLRDDHQPGISYCVLEQLRRRNQFCDVEIKMKNNARLTAHKAVLASSSPYFMKLLSTDMTKSEISFTDSSLDISALEMLIEFIYTSVLRISEPNVRSLCQGAKMLQLERIERACCKFMENNLKVQTCIGYLHFGKRNDYKKLTRASQKFIAENIIDIGKDPSFQEIDTQELLNILSCDDLSFPTEEALFDVLFVWMEHKPESRQKELYHLISSVNSDLSHLEQLCEVAKSPEADLNTIKECFQRLKRTSPTHSSLSTTPSEPDQCIDRVSEGLVTAGGVTPDSTTNSVEKYDFHNARWVQCAKMPRKKSHAALVSACESLYSIGGFDGNKRLSSTHIFDHRLDHWSKGPTMPVSKSDFGAVYDGERHIYCIGGYSGSQDTAAVHVLDTKTQVWKEGPRLNQKRSYVQAAVVDNDTIYAVGGVENNRRLKTVERLRVREKGSSWELVASLNVPRSRSGVATVKGCVYAVGGYSGFEHLKSVERYDPRIDRWTLIECLNIPRNSPAIAVYCGCLYVAGGHDGKKLLGSVECYDPDKRQWEKMSPMPVAKCDFAMATICEHTENIIGTWT